MIRSVIFPTAVRTFSVIALLVAGCTRTSGTISDHGAFAPLALREAASNIFEGADEKNVLLAVLDAFLDAGCIVTHTDAETGAASCERPAARPEGILRITALVGAPHSGDAAGASDAVRVRVLIRNGDFVVRDGAEYKRFFERTGKALFLRTNGV